MKPPSTAMTSRFPSSLKISTPPGSNTASTGECPGRIPMSPSTVLAMMLDDWPDQTTRSAETTSTCMGSAMSHLGGVRGGRPLRARVVVTEPRHQLSFCSSDHLRSTSSRLPTLKKACSAMWSTLPETIIWKDSMVSASGTVEPGMLVNFSAM